MQSLGAAVVALLLGASGCARHVSLHVADTAPASRYTCRPGPKLTCTPAVVDDPAHLNQAGTAFVILPRQCAGRIHRIVVLNASSSNPEVDVTCAPIEDRDERPEPIPEMQ